MIPYTKLSPRTSITGRSRFGFLAQTLRSRSSAIIRDHNPVRLHKAQYYSDRELKRLFEGQQGGPFFDEPPEMPKTPLPGEIQPVPPARAPKPSGEAAAAVAKAGRSEAEQLDSVLAGQQEIEGELSAILRSVRNRLLDVNSTPVSREHTPDGVGD